MSTLASDTSLRDFVRAIASAEAAHGAVSASAVAGGMGASLLAMAAALPNTKLDSADDRLALMEVATALTDVQEQLIETVETETAVKVFTARNMPQADDRQRAQRQAAIQFALRAAADVPLEVMRLCVRALTLAKPVASHSARAASADVQLGVLLLDTAFGGARANLEGKLSSLTDAPHITAVVDEMARLSEEGTTARRAVEPYLGLPPV